MEFPEREQVTIAIAERVMGWRIVSKDATVFALRGQNPDKKTVLAPQQGRHKQHPSWLPTVLIHHAWEIVRRLDYILPEQYGEKPQWTLREVEGGFEFSFSSAATFPGASAIASTPTQAICLLALQLAPHLTSGRAAGNGLDTRR